MIREFAQLMMDADVEVRCNAVDGEVSPDRVNSRNGYRRREWDTRAGTVELAIPKLRAGSYFPAFLEHRRRAEPALASIVAASYLLGRLDPAGGEAHRLLGVVGLSKSQCPRSPLSWTSSWKGSGTGRWMPARTRAFRALCRPSRRIV